MPFNSARCVLRPMFGFPSPARVRALRPDLPRGRAPDEDRLAFVHLCEAPLFAAGRRKIPGNFDRPSGLSVLPHESRALSVSPENLAMAYSLPDSRLCSRRLGIWQSVRTAVAGIE